MTFVAIFGVSYFGISKWQAHKVDARTEQAMKKSVTKHPKHVTYDFSQVKPVTTEDLLKSQGAVNNPIGRIAIPAQNIHLPLFEGLNMQNMLTGACTMKAHEQMGEVGNYAIAGHHMSDNKSLFSNVVKLKKGDKIYLTDNKNIYVYKVIANNTVDKSDGAVIQDHIDSPDGAVTPKPGEKMITLITCQHGYTSENRVCVQGDLVKTYKYTHKRGKLFQYNNDSYDRDPEVLFNQGSHRPWQDNSSSSHK